MSLAVCQNSTGFFKNEINYISEWEVLREKLRELKQEKKVIVFTNGCFDLLHAGHIHCLKEAKKYGDILIVGLNSDASVKLLKGPHRPIKPLFDRANVLAAIRYVDFVIIFNEETPQFLLEFLAPYIDVLVKGVDYVNRVVAGGESVLKSGGKIVAIGWKNEHSTTTLTQRLNSKNE